METSEFLRRAQFRDDAELDHPTGEIARLQAIGKSAAVAVMSGDMDEIRKELTAIEQSWDTLTFGQTKSAQELLKANLPGESIMSALAEHNAALVAAQYKKHIAFAEESHRGYGRSKTLAEHNMELLRQSVMHSVDFVTPVSRKMGNRYKPLRLRDADSRVAGINDEQANAFTRLFTYQAELDTLVCLQFIMWRWRLPYSVLLAPASFDQLKPVWERSSKDDEGQMVRMSNDIVIISQDLQTVIPIQHKNNPRAILYNEDHEPMPPYASDVRILSPEDLGMYEFKGKIAKDSDGLSHYEREFFTKSGDVVCALGRIVKLKRAFPHFLREIGLPKNIERGVLIRLQDDMPEVKELLDQNRIPLVT